MKTYTLSLNENEIRLIGSVLVKQPYEVVCSVIDNINNQVLEQVNVDVPKVEEQHRAQ